MVPLNCAWRCSISSSSESTARTRFSAVTAGDAGREPLEQIEIAGNRPRVERGEQELGVADVELVEVGELAHLMSDHQLHVPERLQHGVDEALFVPADGGSEQNHQVDVRMQAKRPAAVAAERADHQRCGRQCPSRVHELSHHGVHRRGVAGLCVAAAAPLPRLERELAARGRQRRRHLRPAGAGIRRAAGASSRATRVISAFPNHSSITPRRTRILRVAAADDRVRRPGRREWSTIARPIKRSC